MPIFCGSSCCGMPQPEWISNEGMLKSIFLCCRCCPPVSRPPPGSSGPRVTGDRVTSRSTRHVPRRCSIGCGDVGCPVSQWGFQCAPTRRRVLRVSEQPFGGRSAQRLGCPAQRLNMCRTRLVRRSTSCGAPSLSKRTCGHRPQRSPWMGSMRGCLLRVLLPFFESKLRMCLDY